MVKALLNYLAVFIVLAGSLLAVPVRASNDVGVVLLHDKFETPGDDIPIGELAIMLRKSGFLVAMPEMPWSERRYLEKSFEHSLLEIDAAVASLKAQGVTKIVVGGYSLGANTAIGYGAQRDGLAGIMALAPGHLPDVRALQNFLGHDYRRAAEMIVDGRQYQTDTFKDQRQGRQINLRTTADIYFSWFAPDGAAVMPKNVANLRPNTPLLWVVGNRDTMADRGKRYAFDKATPHSKNAYFIIDATPANTPYNGRREIIGWLLGL